MEIANKTEGILDTPAPIPLTMSYDDFYITYGLKFYIKDFEDRVLLKDKIMTDLYEVWEERGLSIPYPLMEVKILGNNTSAK